MKKISKFWKIWFSQAVMVVGTVFYVYSNLNKQYNPDQHSVLTTIVSFVLIILGCILNHSWSNGKND